MEWNNGTVFRVFINSDGSTNIDAKVDIAQQELNNNCFIGVENFVIKPRIDGGDNTLVPGQLPILGPRTIALQNFWAKAKYIILSAVQLPPYIDFTSQNTGTTEENSNNSRNTYAFARLPLIPTPTMGNAQLTTESTYAGDRILNKDSILYDMRNNPFALSNGRLSIQVTDETGEPLLASRLVENPLTPFVPAFGPLDTLLDSVAFTLVIYKASERYN